MTAPRRHILTLLLAAGIAITAVAQPLPLKDGERQRREIQIDIGRACLSGILVMLQEDDTLKASVVNEFGVSFMDFTYSATNDKVKLVSLTARLDKWYIRRMLRRDLLQLIHRMQRGETTYKGKRATYRIS